MQNIKKIEWEESLFSGDPRIDLQHKYLVEIINELAETILEKRGRKAVGKIINLIKYYTLWHFEREEKCMHEVKCPASMVNKIAHVKFIKVFEGFHKEFLEKETVDELAVNMYNTLIDWLVKHIKKVDSQMRHCVHP